MEDVEQSMENNPDQDDDSEDGDEATSLKLENSSEKVSNIIIIF